MGTGQTGRSAVTLKKDVYRYKIPLNAIHEGLLEGRLSSITAREVDSDTTRPEED